MDDEESIAVADLKLGQPITLEYGNKSPILTKIEEPNKFKIEDWYEEEREIYLLDETITVDEPLHYTFEKGSNLKALLAADKGKFGVNRHVMDFLGRPLEGFEVEEDEEEEDEEEDEAEEEEAEEKDEEEGGEDA